MNTIQITTVDGVINYTEAEIVRFIEKAQGIDKLNETITKQIHVIIDMRRNVRDFFSEVEWDDGEQTVAKSDVNELLESIGSNKLTSKYGGSFTITGSFEVEAEGKDEAESMFIENADISFNDGDYTIDDTRVHNVEEEN